MNGHPKFLITLKIHHLQNVIMQKIGESCRNTYLVNICQCFDWYTSFPKRTVLKNSFLLKFLEKPGSMFPHWSGLQNLLDYNILSCFFIYSENWFKKKISIWSGFDKSTSQWFTFTNSCFALIVCKRYTNADSNLCSSSYKNNALKIPHS